MRFAVTNHYDTFFIASGRFDDEPLRVFLADKQVHGVESWHFVHEGTPYWSFYVSYTLPDEAPSGVVSRETGKTDKEKWRKQLGEQDWPVFNALREWRKERADKRKLRNFFLCNGVNFI